MSKKVKKPKKSWYKRLFYKAELPYRQYYLGWSFWIAVILSILGTSLKPLASNHGALAQSKPSPKVLSGAVIYQWQDASGTSTEHFDQSSDHCGTWTQSTEDNNKDRILIIILMIQYQIVLYDYYISYIRIVSRLEISPI